MSKETQNPTPQQRDLWTRELPSHVISTVTFSLFLLTSILQAFMAYSRGLNEENTPIFAAWCALGLAQLGMIVFINVKARCRQKQQDTPTPTATD